MARDPISALDEAISGLELELAANPRFVLLQSLKAARAAFPTNGAAMVTAQVGSGSVPDKLSGRQMNPARKQALDMAEQILREEGEIIKSKDIYARIERSGVQLPGGANNLASLLGRFPERFVSHGRRGWSLKGDENERSGPKGPEENEPTTVDHEGWPVTGSETALHAQTEGDHWDAGTFPRVAGAATP